MPDGAERSKRGLDQVAKARENARQDYTLAEDLLKKKQLASAVDKFHAAVFANPRNAQAHDGLGQALEKLYPNDPKEIREAVVQYKAYMALAPDLAAKDQEHIQKHIAKLETKATKEDRVVASLPKKAK